MAIVQNKLKGGTVVIRLTANATLNVAANSTVNSDIGNPGNDQIRGASISQLFWSTNGNIKISRGGTLILTLTGSDHWNLRAAGISLSENVVDPLNVQFSDTNSSLIVELTKIYDTTNSPRADDH